MFLNTTFSHRTRAVLFIFLLTFQNVALVSFFKKSPKKDTTKKPESGKPVETETQKPTTQKKGILGTIKSKLGGPTKKISKTDTGKKTPAKEKKNLIPLKVRRNAKSFKSWFSDRNPFWMSEEEKAHLADRYGRYYKPKYTYIDKDGNLVKIMPETWKERVAKQVFICFASMAAILKAILMTLHCHSLKAIVYAIKIVFAVYAMTQTCSYIKYIETTPECKSAAIFGARATRIYTVVALKKTLKMSHVKIALTVGRSSLNNMVDKCIDHLKPNEVAILKGPDEM